MRVIPATAGQRGFDINSPLSPTRAADFKRFGYEFVVRYVPRRTFSTNDITRTEVATILTAGLGLMLVQHVEPEGWHPTAVLGTEYGRNAAQEAHLVQVPEGSMVWLDLEGVATDAEYSDVLAYCQNWYDEVAQAGLLPGLYVGWHCGLTPQELYHNLPFSHYWSAYNLDAYQFPAVRGVQMRQQVAPADQKALVGDFDVDIIAPDKLGGLPSLIVP